MWHPVVRRTLSWCGLWRREFLRSPFAKLLAVGLLVTVLLLLCVVAIRGWETGALVGDTVGGIAGAIALLLVAVQVALQRRDLHVTIQEGRETRNVVDKQRRAMEAQAEAMERLGVSFGQYAELADLDMEEKYRPHLTWEWRNNGNTRHLWMRNAGRGRIWLHDMDIWTGSDANDESTFVRLRDGFLLQPRTIAVKNSAKITYCRMWQFVLREGDETRLLFVTDMTNERPRQSQSLTDHLGIHGWTVDLVHTLNYSEGDRRVERIGFLQDAPSEATARSTGASPE